MGIDVLSLAHLAEAQSFIQGLNLSKDEKLSNVYTKDDLVLIITGQGVENVRLSFSKLLSHHKSKINRLFNFGIAGKLDQQLPIDTVYPIKSVYSKVGKSFTINRERGINCFTSDKIISDKKTAGELAKISQVVDMELYAIAEIASKNNLHLSAYKIISDNAAGKVDIKDIIAKSKHFSDSLYTYYINNYRQSAKKKLIWFKEYKLGDVNRFCDNTMVSHLAIEFIEIGDNWIKAKMPVDRRTVQPMGLLHGGASTALAETVGSVAASLCINPDLFSCVGLEINCNHLLGKKQGEVFGTAKPLHIGKKTQVWEIRIEDEKEKLVAVSRLTLAVMAKKNEV